MDEVKIEEVKKVRAHVSQPLVVQNIRTLYKLEQEFLEYACHLVLAESHLTNLRGMAQSFLDQKMQEKLLFASPIQE